VWQSSTDEVRNPWQSTEVDVQRELKFLLALWKANMLAAMEYRASFLTQVIGMILNDGFYFIFWIVFFDRFQQIQGWKLNDMFLLFGLVAAGYGLVVFFFGNTWSLVDVIINGQLDYYLSLPRPVLLHTLASRSISSGIGDTIYGFMSFFLAQQLSLDTFGRFLLGVFFSTTILISYLVLVQSLAFWVGNAKLLASNAMTAVITFSSYPTVLFDGPARFLLFTILPAGLVGAVPAGMVRSFSWLGLLELCAATMIFLFLAIFIFYRGLRRYESGSAIQTQA
jgi:ABC-2 type transport system permease protein